MRVTGIQAKVDKDVVTPNFIGIAAPHDSQLRKSHQGHVERQRRLADTILRKLFGDDMAESEFAPEFEDAIGEFLTIVAAAVARSMQDEGMTVKIINRSLRQSHLNKGLHSLSSRRATVPSS